MIASGSFNQEIEDIVDAYDGNPAKMEEDVRLSGDMKLTMALQQKVKEIEAQERGATLDTPVPTNTIKDQLADKYYNNNAPSQGEVASNVGGVNANIMQQEAMRQPLAANPATNPATNPTSSGIASLNPNLFGGGMARGGIVSFNGQEGSDVGGTLSPEDMAEIDASEAYKNSLLPKTPRELAQRLDELRELIERSPPEDREQFRPALEALTEELRDSREANLQSELDSLNATKEKYQADDPRIAEIFARGELRDSMEESPRDEERVELPDSRPRERSEPRYIRPPITSETRIPTENAALAELEAALNGQFPSITEPPVSSNRVEMGEPSRVEEPEEGFVADAAPAPVTRNAELAELEAAVSGVDEGRAGDFIADANRDVVDEVSTAITEEAPKGNPIDLERVKAAFGKATGNTSANTPEIQRMGDTPADTPMMQELITQSEQAEMPGMGEAPNKDKMLQELIAQSEQAEMAGKPPISVEEVEAEMAVSDEPAINEALTDVEDVVTDSESTIARADAAIAESRRLIKENAGLLANDSIDRAFPDEPAADEDLVVTQIKETLEEEAKEYRPQDSNVDKLAAAFPDTVDYAKEAVENSWILDWAGENPRDAITLGLGALSGIGVAKGTAKILWKQLNTAKTREQIAKAAKASGEFLQKLYTKPGPGGKIDSNVSSLLQDGTRRVFDPTRAAGTGAVVSQLTKLFSGDDNSEKGIEALSGDASFVSPEAMASVAAAFPDDEPVGIETLTTDGGPQGGPGPDGATTTKAVKADDIADGSGGGSSKVSEDITNSKEIINAVATVIDGKGKNKTIKVNKDGKPILSPEGQIDASLREQATDTATFNTDIENERKAQATIVTNEVKALEDRLNEQMERRRSKSIIARMIAFGGAGSFAEGATNSGIRGLAYDKEMDAFENESFAKIRAAKGKIRDDKIAGIKERYAGNVALQNLYINIARTEYDFGIAAENTAFKLAELKLQGIEIRQKDFSNTTMNTYYEGLLSNAITAQNDLRIKTSDANLLAQIDLLATINVKNLGNLMKIKADIDALPSANSTKATTLNEQLEKAIENFSASTTQIEDLIASNTSAPTPI